MSEASDQLSDAFNPSTEEGSPDFSPLPKGSYVASIVDAIVKPFKSGKGQAVFLTWEIADDKYKGRKVWDNCTLSHESEMAMKLGRQRFKDICDACGQHGAFRDLTLLYDKPCLIEEDRLGQYPPKNRINRVKPISARGSNGAAESTADLNDALPF